MRTSTISRVCTHTHTHTHAYTHISWRQVCTVLSAGHAAAPSHLCSSTLHRQAERRAHAMSCCIAKHNSQNVCSSHAHARTRSMLTRMHIRIAVFFGWAWAWEKGASVRTWMRVGTWRSAHREAKTLKPRAATHICAHQHTLMHVIIAVFYGVNWAAARKLGNVPAMPRGCSSLTQLLTRCLHSPLQATQTNNLIPFQKICTLS